MPSKLINFAVGFILIFVQYSFSVDTYLLRDCDHSDYLRKRLYRHLEPQNRAHRFLQDLTRPSRRQVPATQSVSGVSRRECMCCKVYPPTNPFCEFFLDSVRPVHKLRSDLFVATYQSSNDSQKPQ